MSTLRPNASSSCTWNRNCCPWERLDFLGAREEVDVCGRFPPPVGLRKMSMVRFHRFRWSASLLCKILLNISNSLANGLSESMLILQNGVVSPSNISLRPMRSPGWAACCAYTESTRDVNCRSMDSSMVAKSLDVCVFVTVQRRSNTTRAM